MNKQDTGDRFTGFDFNIAYIAKPGMQPGWLRIDWGKSGADWTPDCRSTFIYLQPDGTWNTQPFRGEW